VVAASKASWLARYFGPKRIRPLATGGFIGLMLLLVLVAAIVNLEPEPFDGLSRESVLAAAPIAAFGATVIALVLAAFRALQRARPSWAWVYYLAILASSLAALVARQALTNYTDFIVVEPLAWNTSGNQLGFTVTVAVLSYALMQLLGVTTERLELENQRANLALAELERQQLQLVESQEQVRAELARYLHDGLQSNLLVLGLQMQQVMPQLPADQRAIGQSFLDEIERIRAVDVRRAIRELSPDLEGIGLETAFRELFQRFEKVMVIDLQLDAAAGSNRLETRLKTGVYRIIEQALQNALAHGAASRVAVSISLTADQLALAVSNDGSPVSADYVRGSGLAVVEAWCRLLGGSYELAPVAGGSHFSARLSLAPAEPATQRSER
jgi:signal transduction histidine kinase